MGKSTGRGWGGGGGGGWVAGTLFLLMQNTKAVLCGIETWKHSKRRRTPGAGGCLSCH